MVFFLFIVRILWWNLIWWCSFLDVINIMELFLCFVIVFKYFRLRFIVSFEFWRIDIWCLSVFFFLIWNFLKWCSDFFLRSLRCLMVFWVKSLIFLVSLVYLRFSNVVVCDLLVICLFVLCMILVMVFMSFVSFFVFLMFVISLLIILILWYFWWFVVKYIM